MMFWPISTAARPKRTTPRCAYTLLEVVISTMLVGLILVGAMNAVGAALRGSLEVSERSIAVLLAEDLMSEILQTEYSEPVDTPAFGREGAELSNSSRALWDDVDDYEAWDASPPQEKDGTEIPDRSGWRRWVEVAHVDPDNLVMTLADNDDSGFKRIAVHVSKDGAELASLIAIQTEAWIDMIPEPGNDMTTGSMPPVNSPPIAVADGSPNSGTEIVTVDFDATGSSDPEGDPLGYSWDFDDGDSATGSKPSHTFTNYGSGLVTRTVTLTVTDSYGASDTDTITIYINDR